MRLFWGLLPPATEVVLFGKLGRNEVFAIPALPNHIVFVETLRATSPRRPITLHLWKRGNETGRAPSLPRPNTLRL